MEAFEEFSDLMELADMITERVDNPITIEDLNHHVIAYSTHGDTTDPVRIQTIMKRKVPDEVLIRFWKDGIIQALMHSDEPVRVPAVKEVGLNNRVAVSIRRGQEVFGYIWVQEAVRPLSEEDLDVLKRAARLALPRLLHRKDRHAKQEEKRDQFFWQLLSRSTNEVLDIEKTALQLRLQMPPVMVMLVLEASCPQEMWNNMRKELAYLLGNLGEFFPFRYLPLWTFDDRQLLVLAGLDEWEREKAGEASRAFIHQLRKRLTRRFGSEKIVAAYGEPVTDPTEIWLSYQQALEVMQIKKVLPNELKTVEGYQELGIYRLFPKLKQWNRQAKYHNPKLALLISYDKENQGNLLETLEVFLDNTGKVNQTARTLHIHPNTLAYRLKRICEVGDIDLNNPSDRVMLFLDIKLLKYYS
ncbi:PucR family transcriptional regulator [Aneurinibacillus sp. REN35]|uniref:PucR family transcriptional regulator n=1 Tax=Aneurinibacillus sp. REN35 TaxID=3237286 RepID=UPI003526F585